jgi:outer membrane receptor protein involved in Fe transport
MGFARRQNCAKGLALPAAWFIGFFAAARPMAAQDLTRATLVAQADESTAEKKDATTEQGSGPNSETTVVVTASADMPIDLSRQISVDPSQGIKVYTIDAAEMQNLSQGADTKFTEVYENSPGVSQDGHGIWHIRGEDSGTSYLINGIPLPRGIINSTFGQKFDSRFVSSVSLLDGALPVQYGITIGGILDITSKQGSELEGGTASFYGGSYDTTRPSISYGGVDRNVDYYFQGGYEGSDIGLENPTSSSYPIHDHTDQFNGFFYLCDHLDKSSQLTVILSGSHDYFQIPNTPGLPVAFTLPDASTFDSADLKSTQIEQQDYGMLSYRRVSGDFTLQSSLISGYAQTSFRPDQIGDLILNGEASAQSRELYENTWQTDMSYRINDNHLLKWGLNLTSQVESQDSSTTTFPTDSAGNPTSNIPINIADGQHEVGYIYSLYGEDQWQVTHQLTVNFGLRFDQLDEYVIENQLSPRINGVYQATPSSTLFFGYSRFFAPPQEEYDPPSSVAKFNNTTAAAASETVDDRPRAERSHYFDLGISQQLTQGWKASLEGYYKMEKNVNDEAQVGLSQIYTPFAYAHGYYTGVELASSYARGGFSAFANFAVSRAMGKDVNASQILFSQDDLNAAAQRYVHVNHDQTFTVSTGAAYTFHNSTIHVDGFYGSGFYDGDDNSDPDPGHVTVNLGVEHDFKIWKSQRVTVRCDVVNLFDRVYVIHPGGGVETFAAQYGERRGVYGGLDYRF